MVSCRHFKVDVFFQLYFRFLVWWAKHVWHDKALENFHLILTHCPSQRDMMEKWISLWHDGEVDDDKNEFESFWLIAPSQREY